MFLAGEPEGGPLVQSFEKDWSAFFGVDHSISVNSATSGLITALGAIGINRGDEVITSPWTMSATAASILVYGTPVFADIEAETFNLDPQSVAKKITNKTKAIIVPHIFGHPAPMKELMSFGLPVIEDASQSPGALYHGQYAGTIGDIGVFSLNYHKHIQTGEGGMCVTNNPELARRMKLVRNHGENVENILGFNFRMTEHTAALGIEQLPKLPSVIRERQRMAAHLAKRYPAPVVKPGCTHVYYSYAFISRRPTGYQNIHLLPIFGGKKGDCPVAEYLHENVRNIELGKICDI